MTDIGPAAFISPESRRAVHGRERLPQLLKIHTFFRIDERSKFEAKKRLIFSFVYDDGFGRGLRLHRSLNLEM